MLQQQVKETIRTYTDQPSGSFDPNPLIATIEALFAQHNQQYHPRYDNEPQGMDPYGGVTDEADRLEPDHPAAAQ